MPLKLNGVIIPYEDDVEYLQDARNRQISARRHTQIVPTTVIKTYTRDGIRYFEKRTLNGTIVGISSKQITHSVGV